MDNNLYTTSVGLSELLLEFTAFESELFKEAISTDITELQLINDGKDTSAFIEGKFEDIKNKIIEFVKKFLVKLKSVIQTFFKVVYDKITMSNLAFFKKYASIVKDKFQQLSESAVLDVNLESGSGLVVEYAKLKNFTPNIKDIKYYLEKWVVFTAKFSNISSDKNKVAIFNDIFGTDVSSPSEFDKAIKDLWFEEPKEVKYTDIAKEVEESLTTNMNSVKQDADRMIKQVERTIQVIKSINDNEDETKYINQVTTAYLAVIHVYVANMLRLIKFNAVQARKAFAKAVAYKPVKESELNSDLLLIESLLMSEEEK
jgi:hypothetical protein|nr:MAG TPA: hypothetical protein [Caudoviricetes sp.]